MYSTSRRFPIGLSKHRAGSHLYRDNSCNFGSFPVLHLLFPPLDFTYAYAQIAEADRGFDCTCARDRRFINPLSSRLSLSHLCLHRSYEVRSFTSEETYFHAHILPRGKHRQQAITCPGISLHFPGVRYILRYLTQVVIFDLSESF